jgi:FAD synthase
LGKTPPFLKTTKPILKFISLISTQICTAKTLKIELLEHLRSEIKFPNIEALKVQLEKDKALAQQRIDLLLKI